MLAVKRLYTFYSLIFIITSTFSKTTGSSLTGPRNSAISIAKQIGYGMKRVTYYMDTLIEKCNSFDDLENWVQFMDTYLKCDAEAAPKALQSSNKELLPVQRISLICKHWTLKRKCSSRLATKLNSCLGKELEDGRAGANALRLAEAHMNFVCAHRIEYFHNLDTDTSEFTNSVDDDGLIPVEKLPLKCYRKIEDHLNDCVIQKELQIPLRKFCQKFQAARECLIEVSEKHCDLEDMKTFFETMIDQIELDIEC